MKNKFLKAALLALAITSPALPASAEDGLSSGARAWLAERREIVFAGQLAYPPFEFVDRRSGEYTGMSPELIRWIATEFGFTAVFKPMTFEAAQEAVNSGIADALTGIFRSEVRARRYDFSAEVFEVPASIFVRSERTDIGMSSDLDGKRVAVQRGDYAIEYLTGAGLDVRFVYTDDFRSALALVASGEADAMVGDEQIVLYHIYDDRLSDRIKKTSSPLYVGQDCMAVATGNAILLSVLDTGIRRARETGTLDTINRKWMGVSLALETKRSTWWRTFGLAMAGAALLVALVVVIKVREQSIAGTACSELRRTIAEQDARIEALTAANARLRLDLEARSRLEEDKRRIDAESAARRVEELTRCAIAAAFDSTKAHDKPVAS
ncbi:MAG: hypothetical protein CVV51_10130 [Spirochaetae bacterium HGW-Spirochaetae-7]|jgi:ABC-type amino acid transport substrate-binding protein|nr:MAG: hypothetical protein CVV51_10130 [Spirochaetae bacterium HGW-Spirochaetae-7]